MTPKPRIFDDRTISDFIRQVKIEKWNSTDAENNLKDKIESEMRRYAIEELERVRSCLGYHPGESDGLTFQAHAISNKITEQIRKLKGGE